jgi:hypothetical protein
MVVHNSRRYQQSRRHCDYTILEYDWKDLDSNWILLDCGTHKFIRTVTVSLLMISLQQSVSLEMLTAAQLVKMLPAAMQPHGSLLCLYIYIHHWTLS